MELNIFCFMKSCPLTRLSGSEDGAIFSNLVKSATGFEVNLESRALISMRSSLLIVSLAEIEIVLSFITLMFILFCTKKSDNFLASQFTTAIVSKKLDLYLLDCKSMKP